MLLPTKKVISLLISMSALCAGMVSSKEIAVNHLETKHTQNVLLSHDVDESAGNLPVYIISTPQATYFLEKQGGGLSSLVDNDGIDWLGFHPAKGSGHKGEYRGFPNAIHKQDGSYFHAMNSGTDPASSVVNIVSKNHIRITFTSDNKQWEAQWDFHENRLDFTMSKISPNYHYWIQYEGVPYGNMDDTDFWFSSGNRNKNLITTPSIGDLPAPEWIAFGDKQSPRVLFMLHHQDDGFSDNYVSRPDMTVFGFGRHNKEKYLNKPDTFSIGFIESSKYDNVKQAIENILAQ